MKCVDCKNHRCALFLPEDQPLQVELVCYAANGEGRTVHMEPHNDMKTVEAPEWCPLMQREQESPAPRSIVSSAARQDSSLDEHGQN